MHEMVPTVTKKDDLDSSILCYKTYCHDVEKLSNCNATFRKVLADSGTQHYVLQNVDAAQAPIT